MNHPLRCRCGTIRGHVGSPAMARAVCYCKDCQAYARFLERQGGRGDVLDEAGGTDVVATLSRHVHFEQGLDALVCMSLSGRVLRWYAGCCGTPIANTPSNVKVAYVGLVHSCLSDPSSPSKSLDASFGPARARVNVKSAVRPVKSTPLATFAAVVRIGTSLLRARLSGSYRRNPFFDAASGCPVRQPRVLGSAERAELKRAA